MTLDIYVASLTDYNAGVLHGVWIRDLENAIDSDEIMEEIEAMLEESPTAARESEEQDDLIEAAEWAIHDYSADFDYHKLGLGEHEDLDELIELAKLVDEHGEAFVLFVENEGFDIDTARNAFEEAYEGEYKDEEDFAYELVDSLGYLDTAPDILKNYFDYEAFARDLFIGDYYSENMDNGKIAVFRRC